VLRGDTFDNADELQRGFIEAMARGGPVGTKAVASEMKRASAGDIARTET
jgi:hypothetical protein